MRGKLTLMVLGKSNQTETDFVGPSLVDLLLQKIGL